MQHRRRLLSVIGLFLVAGLLGGCDDRLYWDGYASGEPMLFFTPTACQVRYSAVPAATYYHIISSVLEYDGTYRFTFAAAQGKSENAVVALSQVWTYGLRYAPHFQVSGSIPSGGCALLVAIPHSEQIGRPYWLYENPSVLRQRVAWLRPVVWLTVFISFGLLIGAVGYVLDTYPEDERSWARICAGSAAGVFLCSIIAAITCVLYVPEELQRALDYYTFYDALPRAGGGLLPLSAETALRVFAGPPHPSLVTPLDFGGYFWLAATIHAIWFACYAFRIVLAWYWARLPLPIEQTWEQGVREGRVVTMEEATAALRSAIQGRTEWEMNVLRRKAHVFALKLRKARPGA